MKTYTQMKSIQDFNKKALLGALLAAGMVMGSAGVSAAGTAIGTMTVGATLTSACTVSNSTLNFGTNINGLLSHGDVTGTTGTSLNIACTTGTIPAIWSDTIRTMDGPTDSINFSLGTSPILAETDTLPKVTGSAETITGFVADGTEKLVTIYGFIPAANISGKATEAYTKAVILSVNY